MGLPLRTADQLIDAHSEARWAARRSGPWAWMLRDLWRLSLERAGPIPVDELHRLLPGRTREAVPEALDALDADDLIVVRDGRLTAAYPFSGEATAFAVDVDGPAAGAARVMVWVGQWGAAGGRRATSL